MLIPSASEDLMGISLSRPISMILFALTDYGVRGDSVGAMYWRWVDGSDYDEVIADSINHSQWLQIKRTVKLNNN